MSQGPAKPQRGDVIFVYSGGKDGLVNVALQKWVFNKERDYGPWFSHVALALDDQIALETSTPPSKDDPQTWSGAQLKGGVRVIAIPDLLFGSKYWRVLRSAEAAKLPKDAFLIPKPYISGLYGSKYSIKVFENYAREVAPLVAAASDISGHSAGWTSDPTDVAHKIGEEFRKRVLEDFPNHKFIFKERTFYCSDLVRVILSVLEVVPEQDPQARVTPSSFFDQLKGYGWEDATDQDYSNDAVQAMGLALKATVKNHYDFVVGEAQYWSGTHGFDELWSVVEKKKDAIDKKLEGYIHQLNRLSGIPRPPKDEWPAAKRVEEHPGDESPEGKRKKK
jgi:hypothetical protein